MRRGDVYYVSQSRLQLRELTPPLAAMVPNALETIALLTARDYVFGIIAVLPQLTQAQQRRFVPPHLRTRVLVKTSMSSTNSLSESSSIYVFDVTGAVPYHTYASVHAPAMPVLHESSYVHAVRPCSRTGMHARARTYTYIQWHPCYRTSETWRCSMRSYNALMMKLRDVAEVYAPSFI